MTQVDPGSPRAVSWLRFLGIEVRPQEGSVCVALFLAHFLLLAFQYTAKSVRQSSFIDVLGAEFLPVAYLLVALAAYPVLRIYDRWLQAVPLRRLLTVGGLLTALVVVALGCWMHSGYAPEAASTALYLFTAIIAILLVSQYWSFASQQLDPRQARRLFGLLGAGGLLGSIFGGQVARMGSAYFGALGALVPGAVLLLLFAGVVRFGIPAQQLEPVSLKRVALNPSARAQDGLSEVRSSRYLQLIAAAMLLSATVAQIVDLQFSWVVQQNTSNLAERTAMFGNLYSIMGLSAVIFQLLFTAQIHRWLGVGTALRFLPAANAVGSTAFLVVATLLSPALLLPVVWALKISENGLRYSLDQATRELLYVPIPEHRRPRVKAFIDVVVQRAAKGLAALLLLTVTFGWISVEQTAWLALVLVAVWWLLLGPTRRSYVEKFREGLLRRSLTAEDAVTKLDMTALEILVAGLGSTDDRQVRHSLDLLEAYGRGHLVPPLMLRHDSPEIRRRCLGILQRARRLEALPQIELLLADDDPRVRARAIRCLAALTPRDLHAEMSQRLTDADPRVRAVAVSYLAAAQDPDLRQRADGSLSDMLADADPQVRLEAARAIGASEEPHFQAGLVQLLYDPDVQVARGAMAAVVRRCQADEGNPLYVPILVANLHHRRLKQNARAALVAYGESVVPALQLFMFDVSEAIWVRRALPKTIASIGGKAALRALSEGLSAEDPFQRRKVIEAMGSLCQERTELRPSVELLEAQVATESRTFLGLFLDLQALEEAPTTGSVFKDRSSHLLHRLLRDRMDDHVGNVFGLLALIHSMKDIRAAQRGLASQRSDLRAHALEFLDNVLAGDCRAWVFAMIDELPVAERQRLAKKLFNLEAPAAEEALLRLVSVRPRDDADAAWITAAALHFIFDEAWQSLYPAIRQAAEKDRNPLVQETTALLLAQMTLAGSS